MRHSDHTDTESLSNGLILSISESLFEKLIPVRSNTYRY